MNSLIDYFLLLVAMRKFYLNFFLHDGYSHFISYYSDCAIPIDRDFAKELEEDNNLMDPHALFFMIVFKVS